MVVELVVHRSHVDLHIRVVFPYPGDALGGGQDVHQLDIFYAVLLDKGDGGGGGAAGGQHGVQDDNVPLGDVVGHLAVVLHRLQGVGVPVQADMAHLGGGNKGQDAVHHTQAGPQNGDNGQLFACDGFEFGGGDGSFDLHLLQGQVAGGLIAHQRGDL